MEQKMSPIVTTFIFLVFAMTFVENNNGFPYEDCNWLECKGIKGDKGDCIKTQNCDVLLIPSADYSQPPPQTLVVHRLYWIEIVPTTTGYPYAAVGYSNDKEMVDNIVIFCSKTRDQYILRMGWLKEEQIKSHDPLPALYATKTSEATLCAWTTETTVTREYFDDNGKPVNVVIDFSKEQYIFLGRNITLNPRDPPSVTLNLKSDATFKLGLVECNHQAYIFESFYCWREGLEDIWSLYATIHVKNQSTRFQLTFRSFEEGKTENSISMGLSLYPLSKTVSMVKCSLEGETVSVEEAYKSSEGSKPPITYKKGHIGNKYLECIWSRSSNSWTLDSVIFNTSQDPLYLSIQSNKINSNVPKFSDWPLVFPDFIDEELRVCGGNCVGMRDANETDNKCVEQKKCIITLVVELSEGKYLFSVRSALTFGVWTSVSLSADASSNIKLGFDCAIKGEVDAKPSGEVTTTTNKDEKGSKAVKILNANLTVDGPRRMTCQFEVEKPITFPGEEGTTLDLEQNEAFVTIAYGRFSGQKEKATQSVSLKKSFKFSDDGQAERTFLVILSLTFVALFVVSTLSVIGLGLYLYHPKKRKGVKVKKGAKRKSLKIKSRKSSPVGSKIDKGSPTSNI